jgi:OFA family oxalate/formate antiporter-like MFS transporter
MVGAAVVVGFYLGGTVVYGFTAIFDPIVAEFGWSYAAVSFAASMRGAESGLLEPVAGRLVDRWGPRRLVFVSGLFTAAGLLLLSHTTTLAMFYGAFILLAVGFSSAGTTVLVAGVANWFRARLGLATGIALSGFGLGGFVLPLIVALIARFGWRLTFDILGVGALVLLLPMSFVFRHKPEQYGYVPDGHKPETAVPVGPDTYVTHLHDEPELTARQAAGTARFWLLTIAYTVHVAAVITVVTHIMPYLTSIGFPRVHAGLMGTAIPVLSIAGRLGLGMLGDRRSRTGISVLSYVMMGLATLCLASAPTLGEWALVPFVILFGIGYGGNTALRPALTREHFGRGHFGSIFGLIIGINSIGGIVGPPLAGWLYDTQADYRLAWVVLSVLLLLSAGMVLASNRFKHASS